MQLIKFFRKLGRSIRKRLGMQQAIAEPKPYMHACRGIIHVGANAGQEAGTYAKVGLKVLWYEAIEGVYSELEKNLKRYPLQRAVRALVTDKVGETYTFNISSNSGLSSSILKLKGHSVMRPDIHFVETVEVISTTLEASFNQMGLDPVDYDALVVDTQGSELLVLKGAQSLLNQFKYIMTEAADYEAYEGCCTADEITTWLNDRGFELVKSNKLTFTPGLGSYFDLLFKNKMITTDDPVH